jgi:butyrate kinase
MKKPRILAINPGSTSTEIAVYDGREQVTELSLSHSAEELAPYTNIMEQFDFRKGVVLEALREAGIDPASINVVIGRGGLVKPIPSGIYEVNDALRRDLLAGVSGQHASNLGGLIAESIVRERGAKAYIADPVVVDELQDVARISGLPQLPRVSIFHALNQKAVAREYAARIGRPYEELNLIVAHLGGGISVGAHRRGEVVDVNNALDGEGPFSPERSGTLPSGPLARMCFSGKYTLAEIEKLICGRGGLIAHLGSNSVRDTLKAAREGSPDAEKIRLVIDALSYNIGKAVAAMAAVLEGKVDAIILTGGIAHNRDVTDYVTRMVGFIAPVEVRPGENELEALAFNALGALDGTLPVKKYI